MERQASRDSGYCDSEERQASRDSGYCASMERQASRDSGYCDSEERQASRDSGYCASMERQASRDSGPSASWRCCGYGDSQHAHCRTRTSCPGGAAMPNHWIVLAGLLVLALLPGPSLALSWEQVPEPQLVLPGGTARFQCQVRDRGDNDVIWNRGMEVMFRNSQRNVNTPARYAIQGEFNLVISNVTSEDNMEFTCNVWNLGAKSARLILLLPPEPPTITRNVTSALEEGTSLSLTCSSRGGNPPPTLRWLRNGQEVVGGDPVKEGNVTLSRLPVAVTRADNQANFSCLASNQALQAGSSSSAASLLASTVLSVQYKPYVSFRPYSPLVVELGSQARLSCDVDANPPVSSVSWQRDATRLQESGLELGMAPARRNDSGLYTCSASNAVGTGSGSVNVSVVYAPLLSVEPLVEGDQGAPLTVTCRVDASPPAHQVTWRRVGGAEGSQVVSNTPQLSFPSLQRSHAGNYSCTAANRFRLSGEAQQTLERQTGTQLRVRYKPGVASIKPMAAVSVGQKVDIKCSVTPEGYPPPQFEWRKGDAVLRQQASTLTILAASLSDNARYTCTPSNSLGPGTPNQISLSVNEPPTLNTTSPPASLTLDITQRLPPTLSCVARGRPAPTLTWLKDDDPRPLEVRAPDLYSVRTSNQTVQEFAWQVSSTLELSGRGRQGGSGLRVEDMGNYTCRVVSSAYSEVLTQTTELYIQFPPQAEAGGEGGGGGVEVRVAANLSQPAELPCRVRSFPAPTFTWRRQGGAPLPDPQAPPASPPEPPRYLSLLRLSSVQRSHLGSYTCLASNRLGNVTVTVTLSLTSTPEMPRGLQAGQVTWESVQLQWEAGFNGGLAQHFRVRELGGLLPSPLNVTPPTATSCNVTRLQHGTAYTFEVYGVNALGQGRPSSQLTVLTETLTLPSLGEAPVYLGGEGVLELPGELPGQEGGAGPYCLRLVVRRASSLAWEALDPPCRPLPPPTTPQPRRLALGLQGLAALNASLCLQRRPDVCGPVSSASIDQPGGGAALTEQHVIIIAVVCGVIIISLLAVLVWFICRRKRHLHQHQKDAADSPQRAMPMNGTAVGAKKSSAGGYDSTDGGHDSQSRPDAGGGSGQFLDLGEKRGDNSGWPESGYSTPDPATAATKPKKVIYEVIV